MRKTYVDLDETLIHARVAGQGHQGKRRRFSLEFGHFPMTAEWSLQFGHLEDRDRAP